MAPAIELLYVDEDIVVANKPSGLLVHRGWDDDDDVALFRVRDAVGAHVNAVHRLDRGTSGALLFARTPEATAELSRQLEAGGVDKRYLVLVRGTPPDAGVIDHPVPKKEAGERVAARTRFRRIARSTVDRCSLVEAMPETGRLHQIRRHMKHLTIPSSATSTTARAKSIVTTAPPTSCIGWRCTRTSSPSRIREPRRASPSPHRCPTISVRC